MSTSSTFYFSYSLAVGVVQRCAVQMFLAAFTTCIAVVFHYFHNDPVPPEGRRQSLIVCVHNMRGCNLCKYESSYMSGDLTGCFFFS